HGLRAVSRALQAHNETVTHQLVVTNPLDGCDILDARAAFGFLRLYQSDGDKPRRGQRNPPPEGTIRTCCRLCLGDAQCDLPLHERIFAASVCAFECPHLASLACFDLPHLLRSAFTYSVLPISLPRPCLASGAGFRTPGVFR